MNSNATTVDIVTEIERAYGTRVLHGESKEAYRAILKALLQAFPPQDLGTMLVQLVARSAWTKSQWKKQGNAAIRQRAAVRLQRSDDYIQFIDDTDNGPLSVAALRQFRVLSQLCDAAINLAELHFADDDEIEEHLLSPTDMHEGTSLILTHTGGVKK
jgi:hypothetical protein